jgi:hypothetical protein
MSEILTKLVVDCSTGEESVVPLSAEEISQMEADRLAWEEKQAAAQAEAAAKEALRQSGIAKLVALGLTEEEAQTLVK